MAGEIIRQGDPTSHGGHVLEGSLTDICHGKPIAHIGHKVSCPQCKGTFPIVEGVLITTFYGKGVAVAGMKTSCGAELVPTQFTDVIAVAPPNKASPGLTDAESSAPLTNKSAVSLAPMLQKSASERAPVSPNTPKRVTRLFWTYGEQESEVSGISRHFVDLNLHVETEDFSPGETIDITLANDSGGDVVVGHKTLKVQIPLDSKGHGKIRNVFVGRTVDTTEVA